LYAGAVDCPDERLRGRAADSSDENTMLVEHVRPGLMYAVIGDR
jgi:hypothetical protein